MEEKKLCDYISKYLDLDPDDQFRAIELILEDIQLSKIETNPEQINDFFDRLAVSFDFDDPTPVIYYKVKKIVDLWRSKSPYLDILLTDEIKDELSTRKALFDYIKNRQQDKHHIDQ
jgi:hypothetical protein